VASGAHPFSSCRVVLLLAASCGEAPSALGDDHVVDRGLDPARRSRVGGLTHSWQTTRMGLTMVGSHLLEEVGNGCRNTLTLDLEGPGSS
jgi:hypothetical protein